MSALHALAPFSKSELGPSVEHSKSAACTTRMVPGTRAALQDVSGRNQPLSSLLAPSASFTVWPFRKAGGNAGAWHTLLSTPPLLAPIAPASPCTQLSKQPEEKVCDHTHQQAAARGEEKVMKFHEIAPCMRPGVPCLRGTNIRSTSLPVSFMALTTELRSVHSLPL